MNLASSRDYKEIHSGIARYSVSTRYDGCNTPGDTVKSREMTSLRTLEIFIGAGTIEQTFTPSTLESEAGGSL